VASLYQIPAFDEKAERIRATVRKQSFDGEFFVDNAVRKNGKLEVTRNRSEVCQYFAFFFGAADPKQHAKLHASLLDQFGPKRMAAKKFVEVHPANSFVGNVLRMELLSAAGRSQQILDEQVEYLSYMVDRTGTLWENDGAYASCNHGFASHAVHTLYRDVLGLRKVDTVRKQVAVRIADVKLDWCRGEMPTPQGTVRLHWWRENGKVLYRLAIPEGYQVEIVNATGHELVSQP
jgi:alpha-L-rhamnosidase